MIAIVGVVAIFVIVSVIATPVVATESQSLPREGPTDESEVTNESQEASDPTKCFGEPSEYLTCEVEKKQSYTTNAVTDADPNSPQQTVESDRRAVRRLVASGSADISYVERFARFRIADITPRPVRYVVFRSMLVVSENRRAARNTSREQRTTERTAERTIASEQARVDRTVRTGPSRARRQASFAGQTTMVAVDAAVRTIPRIIDTSDETVMRAPARAMRAVADGVPAAQQAGERGVLIANRTQQGGATAVQQKVENGTITTYAADSGKFITEPVRENITDDTPQCSGEEAEYARCEGEYKIHVLTTNGVEQINTTNSTRTANGFSSVLLALTLDSYNNDSKYYASQSKNRSAALRNIPRESTQCSGFEENYTRCEAEYKTDFLLEDTVNRTYPSNTDRTLQENVPPILDFASDIIANDLPYYDNSTYHPAVEGGTVVAKDVTAATRTSITANEPDCGGEAIEYTRCETEYNLVSSLKTS